MIFGKNSTTVTSDPSRDQTDPSSKPIAPPPTTTSRLGTESNAIAWSLDTTVVPSNFMKGNSTGAEPVAITTFFADTLVGSVPALAETSTVVASTNDAVPVRTVILRALARAATPPTSFAT